MTDVASEDGTALTWSFGLLIPRPVCDTAAGVTPAPDTALGLATAAAWFEAGVAGDSVPIRDLLAAVRGVILPLRGLAGAISRAGERVRTKGSLLMDDAGELAPDPTRRGVRGLLVLGRKFELSAGVMGFPLVCLSPGILDFTACRDLTKGDCSRIANSDPAY